MSRKSPPPIFLQRASYRRRRLRDAAKLMPFLAIILWTIPLAWSHNGADDQVKTGGLIYVFVVWVLLIVLTGLFASRIKDDSAEDTDGRGGHSG